MKEKLNFPKIFNLLKPKNQKLIRTSQKVSNNTDLLIRPIREIIKNDFYLNDIFLVNDNWEIVVRENSNLLEWHFRWASIVPWVILIKLYEAITWKKLDQANTKINFNSIIIPWSKIYIKNDWIYFEENNAMSLEFNEENINIWEISESDQIKNFVDINPNSYLLQSKPINSALSCKIEENLGIWSKVLWEIDINQISRNWKIDKHLLTEWAAQVLSAWISYLINWWKSIEELWENFKIMTFDSLVHTNYNFDNNEVKRIFVEAEIKKDEKRVSEWIYIIKDQDWNILQSWNILWKKISRKILNKTVDSFQNVIKKQKTIEKAKNIVSKDSMELIFSYSEDSWKIIVNNNNINFLKVLYCKLYNLHINNFDNFKNTSIEVKNWDKLEIRTDWLYKDWKNIFEKPKNWWQKTTF